MNRKEYLRFLFSSIILTILNLNADHQALFISSTLPLSIQSACRSIDKKIIKQQTTLNHIVEKLEQNTETKEFLSQMRSIPSSLQTQGIYIQVKNIEACLALLNEIKAYNNNLIQPPLLQKIDNHSRYSTLAHYDLLTSFLRKERIHLLEMNDECIVLRTLAGQIRTIEEELQQELLKLKFTFCELPEIVALYQAHTAYREHKLVQEFKKVCKALWKLYMEKEAKILNNSEFQNLLYDHFDPLSPTPPTYTCTTELKELITLELRYHIKSLTPHTLLETCLKEPLQND